MSLYPWFHTFSTTYRNFIKPYLKNKQSPNIPSVQLVVQTAYSETGPVPGDYHHFTELEDGSEKGKAAWRTKRLICFSLITYPSSFLPLVYCLLLPLSSTDYCSQHTFSKVVGNENDKVESLFVSPALMRAYSRESPLFRVTPGYSLFKPFSL